ncbi:MAG: hypothetical protein QGF46_06110, partial [Planctomycetota bacterium]|nr:hypothetical protein [Planctomycetota bacterium]
SASQFTSPSPATSTAPKKSAAKATKPSEKQRLQSKLKDVKSQLADCRQQLSSAEQQIHAEHLRKTELKEDLAKANAENSRLRRRASELKKNLSSSTEASHREQQLQSLLDECHESLHLAQQKVEWLNHEREDLRSVLEDRDKFDSIQEDDVPNFHERPLLSIERDLKDQISAANSNFNILIVGGGEPQIKHRPKLEGYSEAVGFSATWRQAEYVSWHKEIDKLRIDMSTTFDALVILHWNRTTFTRKAREACNDAGQKPCITCHYQGFTNLRETLQECLRQLLCRQ